jgi:hypothetical protein
MALDRDELKKRLKEKGVKSLDDFNAFMREVSVDEVPAISFPRSGASASR